MLDSSATPFSRSAKMLDPQIISKRREVREAMVKNFTNGWE